MPGCEDGTAVLIGEDGGVVGADPPGDSALVMRRFMMRIAEKVAQRCGAKALVTGECLGQVQ